jgi:hypothetical protein
LRVRTYRPGWKLSGMPEFAELVDAAAGELAVIQADLRERSLA